MAEYETAVRQAVAELNRLAANPETTSETTSEQHTKAIHAMERAVRLREGRGTLADMFIAAHPELEEDGEWRKSECPSDLFGGDDDPNGATVDGACGFRKCWGEDCPFWDKTIAELEEAE